MRISESSMAQRKALAGLIKGHVQGVFFRAKTRKQAEVLGLCGWVRNTESGHVEVLIEGEQSQLESMLIWLQRGPQLARVDSLELKPCDPPGLAGFEVRY
jgi:acylphosphatase